MLFDFFDGLLLTFWIECPLFCHSIDFTAVTPQFFPSLSAPILDCSLIPSAKPLFDRQGSNAIFRHDDFPTGLHPDWPLEDSSGGQHLTSQEPSSFQLVWMIQPLSLESTPLVAAAFLLAPCTTLRSCSQEWRSCSPGSID